MYLAIDIGGTKTALGRFDSEGNLLAQERFPTPPDFDKFYPLLLQTVAKLGSNWLGAGVGLPATIGLRKTIQTDRHPSWNARHLRSQIARDLKLPVKIENDAALAGLAEANTGAGQNYPLVLYVTLSTGVGTAIIIDGHLDQELDLSEGGQMIIDGDNKNSRLEELVSGPAFTRRFGSDPRTVTDPQIWVTYAKDLAVGLFNMITLVVPDIIVLGGGMARHYNLFQDPLNHAISQLATGIHPLPPIKPAQLGENSGLYGSYLLARQSKS